jgi:hypothetical protein
MSNVLKKITSAAKAYRKKHPGASWKSAVKKAGSMYRSGSLKPKRKRSAPKKVARKKRAKRSIGSMVVTGTGKLRKRRKRATARKVTAPRKRRRRSVAKKSAPRRRRVSGGIGKMSTGKMLAFGALAVGVIYMLTKKQAPQTQYVPTGDAYRDSTASRILSIAQQAALSATQIYTLINNLNNSSNAQLESINASLDQGTPITAYV